MNNNWQMQQSQKTFGSQIAIKQLYRQYSGTIKNHHQVKNKTMTQSSNLPFDNFYNALNSNNNVKNISLDKFKNSQAKSIIEKLMQTRQVPTKKKQQPLPIFNQFQNQPLTQPTSAIPLSSTQAKIFYEVVNLLSQIQEIRQKTTTEKDQFLKIKAQLKNQGVQIPELQEKKQQSQMNSIFKRFNSSQLKQIYEQNDLLTAQIEKVTQELTNLNQNGNQQNILKQVMKENSQLKKQLSNVKSQVLNAGQIDEKDLNQMNMKVQELNKTIYLLQQKRLSRLSETDQEFKFLKNQNQRLRNKTIQVLKMRNDPVQRKKRQLIQFLQAEEKNKQYIAQQIQDLKNKYETLKYENSKLQRYESGYNDDPLQVESKVSPFLSSFGEYQSLYSMDKENYLMNFQPQRMSKY